jgi:hypothetical protein
MNCCEDYLVIVDFFEGKILWVGPRVALNQKVGVFLPRKREFIVFLVVYHKIS